MRALDSRQDLPSQLEHRVKYLPVARYDDKNEILAESQYTPSMLY